jgi:hypothetical protein
MAFTTKRSKRPLGNCRPLPSCTKVRIQHRSRRYGESLAQLNQNRVALQAAFQVTATLNRRSLLDYLPII